MRTRPHTQHHVPRLHLWAKLIAAARAPLFLASFFAWCVTLRPSHIPLNPSLHEGTIVFASCDSDGNAVLTLGGGTHARENFKFDIGEYQVKEDKKEVQPGNPVVGAEVETHQWKDGTVTQHLPIQKDNPLRLVQYSSLQQEPASQHPDASCAGSVVSVTASSLWFLLGLIGFRGAAPASLKHAMLKAAMKNPEAVSGLMKIATKLRETDSALERAAQVFLIVKGAVEFGPATLVRVLRHELSWYEWVFFATMLVAQYFAWVLSDGLALIAQIALTILNASQLSIDISKAHQACTLQA